MYAERQARHPRGTYKVTASVNDGAALYCMANLCTGRHLVCGSLWDLVKAIEDDISENRYPQSGVQYRTWGSGGGMAAGTAAPASGPAFQASCLATFVVSVLFRQNATWQGTIQWVEGRQTRQYRSVNELMRLMDEAAGLVGAAGGASESQS